jgi:transposase
VLSADDPVTEDKPSIRRRPEVITIGIDPHKRTHTAVAVTQLGELLAELTVEANVDGHERLRSWAHELAEAGELRFALEDVRNVNGRLERELLAHGEQVVRVPPKLMADARRGGRQFGKSDAIDALAIARAALRERGLHVAHLDPKAREMKLLVDHREGLVRERTILASRLRWYLHDIEAGLEPQGRSLAREATRRSLAQRLARRQQCAQVRICREILGRIGEITRREVELSREIAALVGDYAPQLLQLPGCGVLSAAKLIGEVGGIERFASDAQLASHAGCAPLPASSGQVRRHRLSRHGNRQLNVAFYRIAVTQARMHPQARAYLAKKRAEGKSNKEAFRCLKRHLVRVVWRALQAPPQTQFSSSLLG